MLASPSGTAELMLEKVRGGTEPMVAVLRAEHLSQGG